MASARPQAKTVIPDPEKLWTNSNTGRRVAIINDALLQIGPPLAIELAKAGHDLVIAQPEEGLVKKLEGLGSKVVVIEGVEQDGPNDETNPEHAKKFVDAAIKNFGGFDSAYFRTALARRCRYPERDKGAAAEVLRVELRRRGLCAAGGTAAADEGGPGPGGDPDERLGSAGTLRLHPLCPHARRGEQSDRVRCHDRRGEGRLRQRLRYQLPQLPRRGGEPTAAKRPWGMWRASCPSGRFGEPEEAAHLATALLDGKNMFTTGQTIMIAGGYNSRMDDLKFTQGMPF